MHKPTARLATFCVAVVFAACNGSDQDTRADQVVAPEQAPFVQQTFAYKMVGDERIEADVYRADDDVTRPVLVWIHGGALMFGSRRDPPGQLLDLSRVAGFVLVSIDYRLAPDVQLPAIMEDVEDAFTWIQEEGPSLFGADPDRVAVAGSSAGGYLAMASGFRIRPRPAALVSYWGYGALDTFDAEPSEFYRAAAPLLSAEEAYGEGGNLYLYLRQNGLWTTVVTGFDPETQKPELEPYAPVHNVTSEYPPIMMVHGTNDNDVPYSESVDMAEELAYHEVAHELILVPDGGHGLGGADPELITDAHNRAVAFLHQYLAGEERASEIAPLLSARAALDRGIAFARNGDIVEAVAAYEMVETPDAPITITAFDWNQLCWNGSLWDHAADVMTACERAVALAPEAGGIRDSRGLARALTGDFQGAIEDFEAFVASGANDALRAQRLDWIDALRAGEDPFTPEVLSSFRGG